jgi:hypothetical protein
MNMGFAFDKKNLTLSIQRGRVTEIYDVPAGTSLNSLLSGGLEKVLQYPPMVRKVAGCLKRKEQLK